MTCLTKGSCLVRGCDLIVVLSDGSPSLLGTAESCVAASRLLLRYLISVQSDDAPSVLWTTDNYIATSRLLLGYIYLVNETYYNKITTMFRHWKAFFKCFKDI